MAALIKAAGCEELLLLKLLNQALPLLE